MTEEASEQPTSEAEPAGSAGGPLLLAAAIAAVVAAAFWFGLQEERAGSMTSFFALFLPYLLFGGYAVFRIRSRGELHLLKPRPGDLTFGALVAFLLYGLTFVVHALFTSHGEPREGWIIRVYLLLGNPFSDTRHLVAVGVTAIGLLEELTWRGLVTPTLEPRWGALRAAAISTALWSLAHLPTVFLLADPVAGPNPLLVSGTIGCGFAWSYLRWRMDRLVPVLLSHGLFTWAIVEFPLWSPATFNP
jgi:membrane protease YdiL (CAAX protease family)